jgi:hypothetical protein
MQTQGKLLPPSNSNLTTAIDDTGSSGTNTAMDDSARDSARDDKNNTNNTLRIPFGNVNGFSADSNASGSPFDAERAEHAVNSPCADKGRSGGVFSIETMSAEKGNNGSNQMNNILPVPAGTNASSDATLLGDSPKKKAGGCCKKGVCSKEENKVGSFAGGGVEKDFNKDQFLTGLGGKDDKKDSEVEKKEEKKKGGWMSCFAGIGKMCG